MGAISASEAAVNLEDAIPLEIDTDDVTVHHASLLHASLPNHPPKPRRLLVGPARSHLRMADHGRQGLRQL